MAEKLKILALSDYGTSGISESLAAPLRYWHDQGHEIWHVVVGYTGWAAGVDRERYPWADRLLPIYGGPGMDERFGQKILHKALGISEADILITAFDCWMIAWLSSPERDQNLLPEARDVLSHQNRKFRHIAYFPLDGGVKDNHLGAGLDEMIAGFDFPVTYSRYSQKMIYRDTHLEVPFLPISHDPKIYHPGDKLESRRSIGLPEDKFIVGMVATNQYRKLWGQFVDGCVPLCRAHDDVMILPWTTWDEKLAGGAEVTDLIWRNDLVAQTINPGKNVGRYSDAGMANLYRSLDVLCLITVGEGAGLPPLRARACGTPTLVSDNTSNTEFAVDEFELLPCKTTFYDSLGSNFERYLTDVDEFSKRLLQLYEDKEIRQRLSLKGPVGMAQYESDRVNPYWDRVLEEAMQ